MKFKEGQVSQTASPELRALRSLLGRPDDEARRANSQSSPDRDRMVFSQAGLVRPGIKEDIEDKSTKDDALVLEEQITARLRALGYIE